MMANHVWGLLMCAPSINMVTGKWMSRHNLKADGTLNRYKAHWVLQGFTQCPRVDYAETFSPIVKPATV